MSARLRDVSRLQFDVTRLVRDALAHLDDPAYLQAHPLTRFAVRELGVSRAQSGLELRSQLLRAITVLDSPEHCKDAARTQHLSDVLLLRYVEGLDPARVEERLQISQSTYYREHQCGIEALASLLRDRWGLAELNGKVKNHNSTVRLRRVSHVQLPIYLSSFIGRERELADVQRMLLQSRLLTLTGAGGIGKTRLAVEAVAYLADTYPDGVWFVSLALLRDPDLVLATIAQTLVLQTSGGSALDRLCDFLRAKRLLLVLDNFEHLVRAAADVVALLGRCPDLRVLVTSREPLRITGEHQYHVPTLALDGAVPQPITSSSGESEHEVPEAVRLFSDRAQSV
jgi:hypothetical protein